MLAGGKGEGALVLGLAIARGWWIVDTVLRERARGLGWRQPHPKTLIWFIVFSLASPAREIFFSTNLIEKMI